MRYEVAFYCDDDYLDSECFSSYEEALEFAYKWQSSNPDYHISRIFQIDDDMNYTEVDL